jgi:hypothetical protein
MVEYALLLVAVLLLAGSAVSGTGSATTPARLKPVLRAGP